jgi:hypothetical protein
LIDWKIERLGISKDRLNKQKDYDKVNKISFTESIS